MRESLIINYIYILLRASQGQAYLFKLHVVRFSIRAVIRREVSVTLGPTILLFKYTKDKQLS